MLPETLRSPLPTASLDPEGASLLVQSVQDYAIFMLDPTGVVRSWNAGAKRLKGYEPEEIIGRSFKTFYPPEDIASGKPDMELRVATEVGRFEDEGWRVRKDGTRFWANVVITALRDASGTLVGFGKVTRDLTERRATEESLRQSESRLRLLIEAVQDYALIMLDREGRVATWNTGAERLLGYTHADIVGSPISRFLRPEDVAAGRHLRELETATLTGRFEEEGWRQRKDGTRFWANVVVTAVRDAKGELQGFAKVTRDLTERRAAEEERLRRAKADEAVRLRDEFLSLASHELRTPLTPLGMYLQGIERAQARGEPVDPTVVTRARRQVRRLGRLVEELLDFARVQEGRLELERERFALNHLVTAVVEDFRISDDRREIQVEAPAELVWVNGDRSRLEQVLVNLLQNATKYSPGRAPVRVALEVRGGEASIAVTDEGIGIPADELPQVFERFFRARNARVQNFAGLGLGLHLSRELVHRHGGRFAVDSVQDRGSTFRFSVPLAPAKAAAEGRNLGRLLVVDDDLPIVEAMESFLAAEGFEVATALDADGALRQLRERPFDLLLVDLMLPGTDGGELVARARGEPNAAGTPIAIISAHANMREMAARLRVDAALRKPIDLDDLLNVVQRLTRRAAISPIS